MGEYCYCNNYSSQVTLLSTELIRNKAIVKKINSSIIEKPSSKYLPYNYSLYPTALCTTTHSAYLDDEESFMESILPYVKSVPKIKQMELRVLFQECLFDTLKESDKPNGATRISSYIPSKPFSTQDTEEAFYWGLIPYMKEVSPSKRIRVRHNFFRHLHKIYKEFEETLDKLKEESDAIELRKKIAKNEIFEDNQFTDSSLSSNNSGSNSDYSNNYRRSSEKSDQDTGSDSMDIEVMPVGSSQSGTIGKDHVSEKNKKDATSGKRISNPKGRLSFKEPSGSSQTSHVSEISEKRESNPKDSISFKE